MTVLLRKADPGVRFTGLLLKFGSLSGFALRPLRVRSGFALCPVGVCSGSTLADPDRTPKANPGSGLGQLSVRLGPVGTVGSREVRARLDFHPFEISIKGSILIY